MRRGYDRLVGLPSSVRKAYTQLRNEIVEGSLTPGTVLKEKEIGDRIGVSRTPLRDALSLLRSEGLVVVEHYRKTYVAEFDERRIQEVFDIRSLIEGHAASQAAQSISDSELRELGQLATEMEVLVEAKAAHLLAAFTDLNAEFHYRIVEIGNPRLAEMVGPLLDLPLTRLQRYMPHLANFLSRSCQHHREILTALRVGDSEWAAHQMRAHLRSAKSTEVSEPT